MVEILEPELPIVDPHHHLWGYREKLLMADGRQRRRPSRYLFDDVLADMTSGHNVKATVFVEATAMYRDYGPEEYRSLGETEFVNGVAAMSASGLYGDLRLCAGIVGKVDLTLGARAGEVLDAHQAASHRFRGIRHGSAYHPDAAVQRFVKPAPKGLLGSDAFRQGFAQLAARDLSFDSFCFEPQLPEVAALAAAFPETTIIVNHLGTPLGVGDYDLARDYAGWMAAMRSLAALPNIVLKVGGLGMSSFGFPSYMQEPQASEEQLAAEWKPYVEGAIEVFGAGRCMFESNYPVDFDTADHATIWNVYKRLTAGYSRHERTALFSKTATTAYRLEY